MPETYRVTDPKTGRAVRLTGDSPPTEAELEQIFAGLGPPQQRSVPFKEGTRPVTEEEFQEYERKRGSAGYQMLDSGMATAGAMMLGGPAAGRALSSLPAAARAATGSVPVGLAAGAAEYYASGNPLSAVKEAIVWGLLRRGVPVSKVPGAVETLRQTMARSGPAVGSAATVGATTASASVASAPVANAAASATVLPFSKAVGSTITPAAAAAESVAPSLALSRALDTAAKQPSVETATAAVTALRNAVVNWTKEGKSRETIVRILQRKDYGQSKSSARRAVDEILATLEKAK